MCGGAPGRTKHTTKLSKIFVCNKKYMYEFYYITSSTDTYNKTDLLELS